MNVRKKGHNYELLIIKELKQMGFDSAKSSRLASKLLDNCKVDIADIPFYIQCKSGYKTKNFNVSKEFNDIDTNLVKNKIHRDYPKLFFHKKDGYNVNNEIVTMTKDFFYKLLDNYIKNNIDLLQ
jgi:hypothetical protein